MNLKIQAIALVQRIILPWTTIRFLFLFIGGSILVQAIMDQLWLGIIFGSYFMSMGLFSWGCAAGNCALPNTAVSTDEKKEIEFKEIIEK
jgi:hypothetical protein